MEHSSATRGTQRARILARLIDARGSWVPLPEILELGIAQYNARIHELRRMGFVIHNKRDGEHSCFRVVTGPTAPAEPADRKEVEDEPATLFGDLSPEPSYPD